MNNFSYPLDLTFAVVTTYLMHSTILLLGCWIVLRVFRPSSHTLVARAWKSAAVAGILTTAAQMTLGGDDSIGTPLPLAGPPAAESQILADEAPVAVADRQGPAPQWSVRTSTAPVPKHVAARDQMHVQPRRTPARPQTSTEIVGRSAPIEGSAVFPVTAVKRTIATIAIGWIGIGMVRILWCAVVMRIHVQRFQALVSGRSRRVLDGLLVQNKIHRRICLRAGPPKQEPVAMGCVQWTILIPERFDEMLCDDELAAVFAHELAHFVRRDIAWLWVGKFMGACLGFQPLNLIARRRWQQSAEFLCDQWAVNHGTRQLDLAKCLTRLATWKVDAGADRFSMAATGSKTTLAKRVECLVSGEAPRDAWQTPSRSWLSIVFVTAVTGLVVVAGPGVRAAIQSTPENVSNRAVDDPSLGNRQNVDTLEHRAPVVLQRLDGQISLEDFQSLVRLDRQLTELNKEVGAAIEIADGRPDSKAIAHQIAKIRESVTAIETKRNGLINHFSKEQ